MGTSSGALIARDPKYGPLLCIVYIRVTQQGTHQTLNPKPETRKRVDCRAPGLPGGEPSKHPKVTNKAGFGV